ncbi:ATP-dependent sacrificial sulfur transferase LarE [Candidatus Latescibacterota bacterium]
MTPEIEKKLNHLRKILKDTDGCAVAFSGGVDSSLVLAVAHEMLGDRALAVIATSSTYPQRECDRAVEWVKGKNIPHVVIASEELDIPEFSKNPTNRCYYCKKELFVKVREQGEKVGIKHVADGSNADDASDHRPGMDAACELSVLSPLLDSGIGKDEIRIISKEVYNLSNADKPSMACLASRFPYGHSIVSEKLNQVERIEQFLESEGFRVYRARHHGDILRLEIGPEEMVAIMDPGKRDKITQFAKEQGFLYVTLDLEGYRTGSMNEVLPQAKMSKQV